ncbi:MAG TPA: TrkA family potassium uptake protein [Firmicutes bacterium]|nr:TrkA family potassium uptake protein [Bacillota bacterium]
MNVLIIGCGKLGTRLATGLTRSGHDVSIIDNDATRFEMLPDDFNGLSIMGNPIDQDVLQSAGIEGCDCVVCVTDEDNVNIMAAQIAREIFGVGKVLARILDPVRAKLYEESGIDTICPTALASHAVYAYLFPDEQAENQIFHLGASSAELISLPCEKFMRGMKIREIERERQMLLIGSLSEKSRFVSAFGRSEIPDDAKTLIFMNMIH